MKKMIKILTMCLLGIMIFTNCTKIEGCTDPDSLDYDPIAEKNDGSCTYCGSRVFWIDQSTSYDLLINKVYQIYVYIDGEYVGMLESDQYFTGTPACEAIGALTVTKFLGKEKSKIYSIIIMTEDDIILWSGTVIFEGNDCEDYQIK